MAGDSAITIVLVYPDLLGTYGDRGNATVLAQRLLWRGLPAEVVDVHAGEPIPRGCQIYLLGGGADAPQALAAHELRSGKALTEAVEGGGSSVGLATVLGFALAFLLSHAD